VSYSHTVAAEIEFPCVVPRLDLFARFFHGRGTRHFEVQVFWLDGPAPADPVDTFGPYTVFFPQDQEARNYVFRLQNIPLPGRGRYQVGLRIDLIHDKGWAVRPPSPVALRSPFGGRASG
jgi:hypothetical protein